MPGNNKGLARAGELYQDRGQRARELKTQGQRILGYMCMFTPVEIMTAAGVVPYRLRGDLRESISAANTFVEDFGCPYVRNLFDQNLKGANGFLDGVVISHSCDMVQRIYGLWTYNQPPPFAYFVNVPHTLAPWSRDFFKRELGFFKSKLEEFTGNEIPEQRLRETIDLYNRARALVRGLYELRKQEPPLLTGAEMVQVLVAGMGMPVAEFNTLLEEVTQEVKARKERPQSKPVRLLIYGSVSDDITFVDLVEGCGANVVIDDTCIGTRSYWYDVPTTTDPLEGLAQVWFEEFRCPRTDRGTEMSRFDYVGDLVREYNANGVILYIYSFCDPHQFDAPDLQRYLTGLGIPVLSLADDYTLSNLQSIRTRVQAFVEMIG